MTAFQTNLDLIENANLEKDDFIKHMECHVLGHIHYEINKKFESDDDRKKFFELVVGIYHKYKILRSYITNRFSKRKAKFIKNNDYENYVRFIYRVKKRYYLFGFIPLLKHEIFPESSYLTLFDVIPLLKIKSGRKYFLFNCILILKTRG